MLMERSNRATLPSMLVRAKMVLDWSDQQTSVTWLPRLYKRTGWESCLCQRMTLDSEAQERNMFVLKEFHTILLMGVTWTWYVIRNLEENSVEQR